MSAASAAGVTFSCVKILAISQEESCSDDCDVASPDNTCAELPPVLLDEIKKKWMAGLNAYT